MRALRFVRRHPIPVLGLLAIAFFAWVWWDAQLAQQPVVRQQPPPDDPEAAPFEAPRRRLPLPPGVELKAKPNPQDTAQMLPKLKSGMTRTEVEGLVGVPAANDIHPAAVSDGKVTYYTTYEADLEPPATVRPIRIPRPPTPGRNPQPTSRTLVALEFDATKPGHPLLGIIYPDPLF